MSVSTAISNVTVLSVNVGKAEKLSDGKPTKSGINKRPASGAVVVSELGLVGDAICNTKHHGGIDQAVYCYGKPDYAWWEKELGQPCLPGLFGENLLFDGPESSVVCIGDRFSNGELVLEVTSPRIPCNTLNRRMEDKSFGQSFRRAERAGWYCRVLVEGAIQAGDAFEWQPFAGERIDMVSAMRDYYLRSKVPADQAKRYAATPAHQRWLTQMDGVLSK